MLFSIIIFGKRCSRTVNVGQRFWQLIIYRPGSQKKFSVMKRFVSTKRLIREQTDWNARSGHRKFCGDFFSLCLREFPTKRKSGSVWGKNRECRDEYAPCWSRLTLRTQHCNHSIHGVPIEPLVLLPIVSIPRCEGFAMFTLWGTWVKQKDGGKFSLGGLGEGKGEEELKLKADHHG